ncbi:MAG: 2-amino-4-hydroxy-6-hydroxymethyldihydropteridine diphosphokinase [Acidobacteria bacterium]|nr:2-amino-4-hydroxy-6-hydroxymethyldihydropteridine diphosphokinase [Acidobacteriota bacterium]
MTVYLSLGSNMGNRLENLRRACQALAQKGIPLRRLSSVYETEPVDFAEQDWFLNCVVEAETTLPPLALLQEVHQIEEELGRQREQP